MIEGSGGITGANPPGSPGQLAALEGMWTRHGLLEDGGKLAAAVMSLVAARDSASEEARVRDEQLMEVIGSRNGLEAELSRVRAEGERLAIKLEELKQRVFELESARDDLGAERDRLNGEVERLNAVLELITSSRTWRAKEFISRFLGRSQSQ
jgi:chromosome segregation ATPase